MNRIPVYRAFKHMARSATSVSPKDQTQPILTTLLETGGGTAARLILELWPSLQLEGWEIGDILIEKAREYLGLSEIEKPTSKGGSLCVRVDEALSPSQDASRRYAGIIVDLFADGKVLDQLQQVPMWLELASRIMPNGRIMVNCAGIKTELQNGKLQLLLDDSAWMLNSTVNILPEAFPGQVSWKRTPDSQGLNFLAMTGSLPDLGDWSNKVPVRSIEQCSKAMEAMRDPLTKIIKSFKDLSLRK